MKRITLVAVSAALIAGALALGGCTPGSMGGQAHSVWGYIAMDRDAQLDVAADQPGAKELTVSHLLVPEDAWVVVHDDENGKPGPRVGLLHVTKGAHADVKVPLDNVTTDKVIVALHADRATPGTFDFDMKRMMQSADRPFFVDRKELARVVTVR